MPNSVRVCLALTTSRVPIFKYSPTQLHVPDLNECQSHKPNKTFRRSDIHAESSLHITKDALQVKRLDLSPQFASVVTVVSLVDRYPAATSAMDRVREFFRLSPTYTSLVEDALTMKATHSCEMTWRTKFEIPDTPKSRKVRIPSSHGSTTQYSCYLVSRCFGRGSYSVLNAGFDFELTFGSCRNMFLAAGPYFQKRFQSSDQLLSIFQPAELTVSTVANLGSMLVLTNLQARASYPKRIIAALLINIGVFTLMAMSTRLFLGISAQGYFIFLVIVMFVSSLATGLMQNGIFAYMSGFGRKEYAQGNMTGQAIAGVLPCIVQITSVLSAPPVDDSGNIPDESSSSAMAYFLTATGISFLTLIAFLYLLATHGRKGPRNGFPGALPAATTTERKRVPLLTLFRKTFWLSVSVFLTFAVTMTFPVFTQQIVSVQPPENLSRYLQPASFIPLALLVWNSGATWLGGC